ncbi:MAG: DUF1508 domain-containing protein [Patescibacteria group bacterium]
MRFEIYRDNANEYRWRLVAANNEFVAWSEGYSSKQNAIDSVQWIKRWAASVPIHDLTI